jgi:ubiquitin C-terminal hydrolase
MYGGGPTIKTDPTIDFLLNSIVPAVGLSNESQYCYMNAALQVLVSTE